MSRRMQRDNIRIVEQLFKCLHLFRVAKSKLRFHVVKENIHSQAFGHHAYLRADMTVTNDADCFSPCSSGSYEARGKTIGIIGYGHIGAQVSVMAESLGMNVLFYDVEPKLALGNAKQVKTLEELFNNSDVVTLHAPGHPSTKNMINENSLRQMKKGAILINCSRGDLMDDEAVKKALTEKQIGGLGLD